MKINKHVKAGAEFGARTIGGIIALVLKIIGTIILVLVLAGLIFTIIFAAYVKNSLSSELGVNLSDFSLSQTSIIYYWDSDTGTYQELDQLSGRQKRTWVNYEDIPKEMEYAAVAIEDKRFYVHHGVDWYRTVGAFGNMFLSMSDTFGGSTITQQLIKNLTEYDEVTVKRKLLEIFRALDFEKTYSKEEIMEWYLNSIYLGEGCWGISSAAEEYFGKDVSELTIAECACLIGITNNPSMYDPYIHRQANKERQEIILGQMYEQEYITEAQYKTAMAQELVFTRGKSEDGSSNNSSTSWFVDALIEDVIGDIMAEKNVSYHVAEDLLYSAGYKIYATVDPEIQAIVDEVYSSRDNFPAGYKQSNYQQLQSAIVITDPKTGYIVAMAGGMGEKDGSRLFNRATDMKRSPGSSIKPLASYSLALERGLIMPYTTFYDSASVKLSGTDWYPNNDNYANEGQITIRYALQRSINTVAAQLIDLLTPEVSFEFVTEKLGLSLIENENGLSDTGYASLALGQLSYGVSVREMASAYTALANSGIRTETVTYTKIEDSDGNIVLENIPESTVALSDVTAYYMTDMLQNVVNAGTGYYARLSNMPAAGKTGASSNWCDRWFVGYTPYYVGAVWCGYDIPEYMGSSNPSTGMWKQVMEKVHANIEYTEFPRPDGMKKVTVCIDTGLLATDACRDDVRGDRTMTLYMTNAAAPTQTCQCHTYIELCSESNCVPSPDCPESCIVSRTMLDLSKANGEISTPPYYTDKSLYKVEDPTTIEEYAVPYVINSLETCELHKKDSESGWYIDTETGYLKSPVTGMLYDPETDTIYDQYSGWAVDWKTGALIDPSSGELIDPHSGETFIPSEPIDEYSPDVIERPPNYQKPVPVRPTEPADGDTLDITLPPDPTETPDISPEPTGNPDGASDGSQEPDDNPSESPDASPSPDSGEADSSSESSEPSSPPSDSPESLDNR